MGNSSFFFNKTVGSTGNEVCGPYRESVRASIQLVQNGYELHYMDKEFVASTLDEGMKMIKKWMEEGEESARENDGDSKEKEDS